MLLQSADRLFTSITIRSVDNEDRSQESTLMVTADSFSEIDINWRT